MKVIKLIGHPVSLVIIFMLLIIEGNHFGGFYLLYLLMALPHAAAYGLLALAGIASLLLGFKIQPEKKIINKLLSISGLVFMILSLILFFAKGNKDATFEQTIPLLTFILFGISIICFLVTTFLGKMKSNGKKQKLNIASS